MIRNNLLMAGEDEGYKILRSLRFRSSASAFLSRTPASKTNAKVWTYSAWIKRGSLGTRQIFFEGYASGAEFSFFEFTSSDTLRIINTITGSTQAEKITTQVFRDPSAWYHIVVSSNSSTSLNIYVNGVQVTSFSTSTGPNTTDWAFNQILPQVIGADKTSGSTGLPSDIYQAELNWIDGQALTPSSFGSTNSTTGVWQPARYTGTYGTNGFYLPFTDNSALTTSSNVGLGKDFSGNGNYWTTNNISITAGTTYDSMTDVPTLTSATAANFAVLNPLNSFVNGPNATLSNGNLLCSSGLYQAPTLATMQLPTTGKYYWEITVSTVAELAVGINAFASASPLTGNYSTRTVYYRAGGASNSIYIEGTVNAFAAASYTNGDVIAVAYDATVPSITFYKNNVSQGTYTLTSTANLYPYLVQSAGSGQFVAAANFGQQPFAYTPPSGFNSLNAYNLPDSTIKKSSDYYRGVLDTGANILSTTQAIFSNGLEIIKDRANANNWQWLDSLRTGVLQSNNANAETTYSAPSGSSVGYAFRSSDSAPTTNTSGTITSTVSANPSSGFSLVEFNGSGANATVGHGLNVAPSLIIAKAEGAIASWTVGHKSLGWGKRIYLESQNASVTDSTVWNNTAPTSSVFSVGTFSGTNASGTTYIAYCFADIDAYLVTGRWDGNSSADGPFLQLNGQPLFFMWKRDNATTDWEILDSSRDTYNPETKLIYPNQNFAEYTGSAAPFDFVSNGIKIRSTGAGDNASGGSYIYMAVVQPFKYSNAR